MSLFTQTKGLHLGNCFALFVTAQVILYLAASGTILLGALSGPQISLCSVENK